MKIKNTIKLGIILFALITTLVSNAGSFVANKSHCLNVDSSRANTIGDIAFLENNCGNKLKVKYCFGNYKCETNKGSNTVIKYDKKSIFYDKDKYDSMSLIAFASDADVDFQDCYEAQKEYLEYK